MWKQDPLRIQLIFIHQTDLNGLFTSGAGIPPVYCRSQLLPPTSRATWNFPPNLILHKIGTSLKNKLTGLETWRSVLWTQKIDTFASSVSEWIWTNNTLITLLLIELLKTREAKGSEYTDLWLNRHFSYPLVSEYMRLLPISINVIKSCMSCAIQDHQGLYCCPLKENKITSFSFSLKHYILKLRALVLCLITFQSFLNNVLRSNFNLNKQICILHLNIFKFHLCPW